MIFFNYTFCKFYMNNLSRYMYNNQGNQVDGDVKPTIAKLDISYLT